MFSLLDIRCIPHSPQKPVYSSQAFVMQNWNFYRFFSFSPTIQPVCIALLLDIQCSPLFSRHNSEFFIAQTWFPNLREGFAFVLRWENLWERENSCLTTSFSLLYHVDGNFPTTSRNFTIYSNDAQQRRSDKSYQKSSSARVRGCWGVKFAYQFSNYIP